MLRDSALLKRGGKKSNAEKLKPKKHSQGVCTDTACVRKAVPSVSNLPEEHLQAPEQQPGTTTSTQLPPAPPRRLTPGPQSQAAAFPRMSGAQAALSSSLPKLTLCRAYGSFLAEDFFSF